MTWVFSKRCQKAIKEDKLKVSIPKTIRVRLWNLLTNFDKSWVETTDSGFNYWTSRLEKLTNNIKAEHGLENLSAYSEEKEKEIFSTNLEGFILRGFVPAYIWDAIELFYISLPADKQTIFQKEFNQIMEESNLNWRMAEGRIFPIDSAYIEEEIIRRSYQLLNDVKFLGPLQEFEKSREDLTNGDYEGAIQNAYLAVESTIKCILNIQKAKQGQLYKKLIESGLVPNYYDGFLRAFEENILRSVAIIRNEEPGAGHGKGKEPRPIPKSLAELAVNLSGVLINYLVKKYIETLSSEKEDKEIPF
jgi:hypothetical protein